MSKEMIKQKLHNLVDQLEDKEGLQKLYAEALALKYSWMEDDSLTEEEWSEITDGLAQIREGEPCTHEAAIEKFMEWQRRK